MQRASPPDNKISVLREFLFRIRVWIDYLKEIMVFSFRGIGLTRLSYYIFSVDTPIVLLNIIQ